MKATVFLLSLLMLVLIPSCAKPGPTINLKPCNMGNAADLCGKLTVYENRVARSGRKIDLNIRVIRANLDRPSKEAVFPLSGGPGVAATTDSGNLNIAVYVAENRDIVLVDQRGTGKSNEFTFPDPPAWSGLTLSELETAFAAWIKEVLPRFNADPRYYTTSIAMDDLDDVRAALGYDKIDLIGTSYGTTAAQYYLRQHEAHVRSVVLISGSVGNVPIWERHALNAQRALDATFARCEADSACQAAFPDVKAEFASLMEKLAQKPVEVKVGDGMVTLTSPFFAAKVEDMLRTADRAARLPLLIHKAYAQDDWREFAVASYGDWTRQLMGFSIQCNEKWAAFSPEEVSRWGQGSFLFEWNLLRANNYTLVCKYLPRGVTHEGDQPPSKVPVLLINGELDPLDPPENTTLAKEIWPNSLSLVLPGQGHSISNAAVFCVEQISKKFIADASVQALPSDCLESIQPPPFDTGE